MNKMERKRDRIKRLLHRFWLLLVAGLLLAAAMAVSVQGNFGGFDINVGPGGFDSDFEDWNESGQETDTGETTAEGNSAGSGSNEGGAEYAGETETRESTEGNGSSGNTEESRTDMNGNGSSFLQENPVADSGGSWGFTSPDSVQDSGDAAVSEQASAAITAPAPDSISVSAPVFSSTPTPLPVVTPVPSPTPVPVPSPTLTPAPSLTSAAVPSLTAAGSESTENPDILSDSGNPEPAVCRQPAGLFVRKWDDVPPGCLKIRLDGDKILSVFSVRVNNRETKWSYRDGGILVEISDGRRKNHLEIAYLSLKEQIFYVDESGKECYTIH